MLDHTGLSGIIPGPAYRVVKDADKITYVILAVLPLGAIPVEEIQQLEVELQAEAADDYVLRVKVTVVFIHPMNAFYSLYQRIKEM
jgi:hypothetical protein